MKRSYLGCSLAHVALAFACSALSVTVCAQSDPMDMESYEDDASSGQYFLETRTRYERTNNIPARADDIDRLRLRIRTGWIGTFDAFELGAAVEGQLASSDNASIIRNKDNERADTISIDQLYARYALSEFSNVVIGKTALDADFSPMLWDSDYRPIGLGANFEGQTQSNQLWRLSLGYYAPDPLFDEDSRMGVLQFGWRLPFSEGRELGAQLGYLHFSSLEELASLGVQRTNRRIGSLASGFSLQSDYEQLDLQLSARTEVMNGRPLQLKLDAVKNLGADDADEGMRAEISLGDARGGGWEAGVAYQRVQRDAVLSVFADDDWWFQSFARGVMPWVAFGFTEDIRLRVSGFKERRDGIAIDTDRVLIDVHASW
jgi:hypothetical protein